MRTRNQSVVCGNAGLRARMSQGRKSLNSSPKKQATYREGLIEKASNISAKKPGTTLVGNELNGLSMYIANLLTICKKTS